MLLHFLHTVDNYNRQLMVFIISLPFVCRKNRQIAMLKWCLLNWLSHVIIIFEDIVALKCVPIQTNRNQARWTPPYSKDLFEVFSIVFLSSYENIDFILFIQLCIESTGKISNKEMITKAWHENHNFF